MKNRLWSLFIIGILASLPGCDSDTSDPSLDGIVRLDGRADLSVTRDGSAADLGDAGVADTVCQAVITSCDGLCGHVVDPCTGNVLECGPCGDGEVCNLETHTCITPKVTCDDLGAECGLIKNSCGKRLDCGSCVDGKECDPDTNKCVDCQNVSCQDLGYQCGASWLGCGPKTNTTDCGACADGQVCNTALHICEPNCTPQSTQEICDAAAITKGVECGYITDNCGGLVNCGDCPAGEFCGLYGVANRCDPADIPDECRALGYNCGTLSSACGGTVSCGECADGQSCVDHKCQTDCVPKTCADYATQDGWDCGQDLDNGCGGTIDCGCAQGICLENTHTCCVNENTCPAGACDQFVLDSCTGEQIDCTCPNGQYCNTTTKLCEGLATCSSLGKGGSTVGTACNDNAFYDRGDGTLVACPCTGGAVCVGDSASQEGSCCRNTATCPANACDTSVKNTCTNEDIPCTCNAGGVCQNGTCCYNQNTCAPLTCNTSVTNSCTGDPIQCTCPSGYYCSGTTCLPYATCASLGYTGEEGLVCSNGPSFDRGDGTLIRCGCDSGLQCLNASNVRVSGATRGTCFDVRECGFYTTRRTGQPCSNGNAFDTLENNSDGSPVLIRCSCVESVDVCADSGSNVVSGTTIGTCQEKRTCAYYNATGAIGSTCGNLSDGFGGTINCNCTTSGGLANNTCVNGTCTCSPDPQPTCTCDISGDSISNGCGGTYTLSCPCTGSTPLCNTSSKTCCPQYTCSSLPSGVPAGACGRVSDPCMGGNISCPCDSSGKPNNSCVLQSGETWGTTCCCDLPENDPNYCGLTCADTGAGLHDNKCGQIIDCQA